MRGRTAVTAALIALSLASSLAVTSPATADGPPGGGPGATGRFAYVANAGSRTVSVMQVGSPAALATIPVPAGAEDLAVSPRGDRVYVTGGLRSHEVSVIDTSSRRVVRTIRAGDRPVGVAVTARGSRAVVANAESDTVSVIDTRRDRVVRTLKVGDWPRDVAITPNGRWAYVTNLKSHSVSVIDVWRGRVFDTIRLENDTAAFAVALSADGRQAYVTGGNGSDSLTVIDTVANEIVDSVQVPKGAENLVVTPEESAASETPQVYVSGGFGTNTVSVIDPRLLIVIRTFTVPYGAEGLAINANGDRLLVTSGVGENWLTVVNAETDTVMRAVRVGWNPLNVAMDTPPTNAP
ncbi:YncE family protein [Streptomyces sp. NPDC006197]|uniref:YncE family protein n=1 Tax=Streptomyces sp. NPDC006197 TaxID=3156685 RepID=UPI0033B571AA